MKLNTVEVYTLRTSLREDTPQTEIVSSEGQGVSFSLTVLVNYWFIDV